jgi:hypothetical protein
VVEAGFEVGAQLRDQPPQHDACRLDPCMLAIEQIARGAAHDRQVVSQQPARQARPLVDQFRQCAAALGIQCRVEQHLHHRRAACRLRVDRCGVGSSVGFFRRGGRHGTVRLRVGPSMRRRRAGPIKLGIA